MKTVEFGGIIYTNKTAFEIQDMVTEFRNGWKQTLVPTFRLASELYNETYKFRSDEAVSFNKFICTNSHLKPTPATFAIAVNILASNYDIDDFCKRFTEHFKNGIDIYSLSVADTALINRFSGLQLFSQYSTLLLHYISILECNTYSENTALSTYGLTKQQVAWIVAQTENYRKAIGVIGNNVASLFAEIERLPTTFIATLNEQKVGFSATDAEDIYKKASSIFKMVGAVVAIGTGIGALAHTFYWRISGGQALMIAKNIQKQKQLKTALELRLVHLRNLRDGTPSASVEKNIQITEDRLRKIEKELLDAEKKYGN